MIQNAAMQILNSELFHLPDEPARRTVGRAIALDNELLWNTVIDWCERHRRLFNKISKDIRPFFPGENSDVFSLAQIVAFETLQRCAEEGRLELFFPIFYKRFRYQLIDIIRHVPIESQVEVEEIADPNLSPYFPASWPNYFPTELVAIALAPMTKRQRAAWVHYLGDEESSVKKRSDYKVLQNGTKRVAQARRGDA